MNTHPPYLTQGSTIGITCPAGYVSHDRVSYAVKTFEDWGFKVIVGKTVGNDTSNYFAGTDDERMADLQAMLDNPQVDAIIMGRGGYGLSRIIDRIDFTAFLQKPKWITGFSDIVVLLNHVQALYNMPVLHAPMCGAFKPDSIDTGHIRNFHDAITGKPLIYKTPASVFNRPGSGEAILTGGNLAILAHLTGSVSEVDTTGKLLFIEDIGEHYYHIDRLMLNLKRAGKLDKLAGLIVGSFTEIEDTTRPFGQTVEEIIWDKVKEYDYPVCFNFPCGHQEVNYTLSLNMKHRLVVDTNGGYLELLR